MKQDKITPIELWEIRFGKGVQDTKDYTGRAIKKAAYNQEGSNYGWVVEYILPIEKGGDNSLSNVAIVSCLAHVLRDGELTYLIDGIRYQVKKDGNGGYGICSIANIRVDKGIAFWNKEFGSSVEEAMDFAGYLIKKCAYRDENSQYGWDIDHIQPLSKGGANTDNNKQISSISANREKADKTTFDVEGRTYQVKKSSKADQCYYAGGYDYSEKKYCVVEIE